MLLAAAAGWLLLGPYGVRATPPTTAALVATSDLPPGHVLGPDDVTRRDLPSEAVPGAALGDPAWVIGRRLAAAVTRGETLTNVRVRGGAGLPAGLRGVHVPLADPAAVAGLAAGDHVDVVAVADGGVVVTDAVVLDVDRATSGPFGGADSARGLTLAVPVERVGPLTSAALGGRGGVHTAVRNG